MKHAPGPWQIGTWGEHTPHEIKTYDILIEDINEDADIAHAQKRYTKEQTEANARLIAVAPDMLNVLIEFCEDNCNDCDFTCDDDSEFVTFCGLKSAKKIIEKATGMKIKEVLGTARIEDY